MSERLEAWKSREKLRSAIGWMAVYLWFAAALVIVGTISNVLELVGIIPSATERPNPVGVPLGILLGAGMVWFGFGLWNARQWARWVVVALSGACAVGMTVDFARGDALNLWIILHIAIGTYLLLPSTGRHFARAQALAQAAPARR